MSRIAALDPTTAPGPVKALFDGVAKGLGMIPNMFRVAGQAPSVLETLVAQFGAVGKGRLSGAYREAIAIVVSELDGCDYCLSAHTALGKGAGLSDAALDGARSGASADPKLAATLRFTRRIVELRGRVGDGAVTEVRAAGLSDAEILEVVANVALTTFTNYLNEVAGTEVDFPLVAHRAR